MIRNIEAYTTQPITTRCKYLVRENSLNKQRIELVVSNPGNHEGIGFDTTGIGYVSGPVKLCLYLLPSSWCNFKIPW